MASRWTPVVVAVMYTSRHNLDRMDSEIAPGERMLSRVRAPSVMEGDQWRNLDPSRPISLYLVQAKLQ